MSRPATASLDSRPLISIVDRLHRALQTDMITEAHARGFGELRGAHNLVLAWLPSGGARTADMATRAGVTRQSMGEVVRDLVDLGIVTMTPDPSDRRAKLVTLTDYGRSITDEGFRHIADLEQRFADAFGADEYARIRASLEEATAMVMEPAEPA